MHIRLIVVLLLSVMIQGQDKNFPKEILRLVRVSEEYIKADKDSLAEELLKKTIDKIEKYNNGELLDPVLIAECYYLYGQSIHKKLNTKSLEYRLNTRKMMKEKKTAPIKIAVESYKKVIKIGNTGWSIKAHYQIGMTYVDFVNILENQKLFGNRDQKLVGKIQVYSALKPYYNKSMEHFAWVMNKGFDKNIQNKYIDKSAEEYAKLAYERGYLFIKLGLLFKNSPCPRDVHGEDCEKYKAALEKKNFEAIEKAVPEFEDALRKLARFGITNTKWEKKCREMIAEVKPESETLNIKITPRKKR